MPLHKSPYKPKNHKNNVHKFVICTRQHCYAMPPLPKNNTLEGFELGLNRGITLQFRWSEHSTCVDKQIETLIRVTRFVCKKVAQSVAQTMICQI
jgi:hypothetical protein